MPANKRKALTERLGNLAAATVESTAKNLIRNADMNSQPKSEPPSAEEIFRSCTAKGWNHEAWQDWYAWSKLVRDHDWFDLSKPTKPQHKVHYYGEHDDALSCEYPEGEFHKDRALAILQEFDRQDIVSNFADFWDTIHACLQYPQLTPAALRVDSQIYAGSFGLKERRQHAVELLQRKGLQCR